MTKVIQKELWIVHLNNFAILAKQVTGIKMLLVRAQISHLVGLTKHVQCGGTMAIQIMDVFWRSIVV